MIAFPSASRTWLACGVTDMRKGMCGLAVMAQEILNEVLNWMAPNTSTSRLVFRYYDRISVQI